MAKRIISVILVICCLLSLSACGCKHKTWLDATCSAPKTCSECGAYEGIPLGHIWHPANCTEDKVCDVCGEIGGEALGHDWAEASCAAPKTCGRCGLTEGEALPHTWVDATCTDPKTCSVCGSTEGEALGHDWISATLELPKTCDVCAVTEGEPLTSIFDSDISLQIQESLNESMASLSPTYAFDDKTSTFYIVLTPLEGTANNLASDPAGLLDSWETVIQGSFELTDSVSALFLRDGYEVHCTIIYLNDANTENMLLEITDDEIIYNVMDDLA